MFDKKTQQILHGYGVRIAKCPVQIDMEEYVKGVPKITKYRYHNYMISQICDSPIILMEYFNDLMVDRWICRPVAKTNMLGDEYHNACSAKDMETLLQQDPTAEVVSSWAFDTVLRMQTILEKATRVRIIRGQQR